MSEHPASHLDDVTIAEDSSIADALERMDRAGTGALALRAASGEFTGILTDGDVRRAVLRGVSIDQPCGTIANRTPVVARGQVASGEALQLMAARDINHLPVVDEDGILTALLLRNELATREALDDEAARRLDGVIVGPETPIADAIQRLDAAGTGAVILCREDRTLAGLVTDGDVRRAILRGVSLSDPCAEIAMRSPITALSPVSTGDALDVMVEHEIDHLPVLDGRGRVVDFLLRREIAVDSTPPLSAVIMAGGFGRRLMPLTEDVPKPMLPVGDRPLLERTIEQLRRSGVRDVSMTTHYLPESIVGHFGDGSGYGVRISYANEEQPLGTAGGLRLIERPSGPFVVINGDILTGVPFDKMLDYHRAHEAEATVGVRQYVIDVPFGVVECDDARITELREKPSLNLLINAGVYLLQPSACDLIPEGRHFDMTDLVKALLDADRVVVSFPIIEYWLDVGRPEDYQRAQDDLGGSS
jgi:dTDP-glucose pyrophosphorylase/CBS domain-containing protein